MNDFISLTNNIEQEKLLFTITKNVFFLDFTPDIEIGIV